MKPRITFDKSAASFIIDCFPDVALTCGICGATISDRNLGGLVPFEGQATYVCDFMPCIMELAKILNPAGEWICTCDAGECDFETEEEAVEARDGTFCGKWLDLKRKVTTEKPKTTEPVTPWPFMSCAEWPADVYTDSAGSHVSRDGHDSEGGARSVCGMLERDGFGGDGVHYPVRTWVENSKGATEEKK